MDEPNSCINSGQEAQKNNQLKATEKSRLLLWQGTEKEQSSFSKPKGALA